MLLASFTASNDPVIHEIVGKLSKATGGASPRDSDRDAGLFLQAFWNLMRSNISYESAQGSIIDGLVHQHLKYGRDVLRTKSGTCINTSIFFASVAEAAGLNAYLVMVPGHAFAGVRLPQSRQFVFVETTGCGGGTVATSGSFDQVRKKGAEEFQAALKSGLFLLVGISDLRNKGVTPPELPDAGPGALEQWQIVFPGEAAVEKAPDPDAVPVPRDASTAVVVGVRKDGKAIQDGRSGMAFHVHVKINQARGTPCEVMVVCVDENKELVKSRVEAYSLGGNLGHLISITPDEDAAEYEDLVLFLPYEAFDLGVGEHRLAAVVLVGSGGKPLSETTENSVVPITITRPGDGPPAKKADHPLPKYFDQLDLTAEQQQKVGAVMDEYDDAIERHLEQIRKLRGKPFVTSIILAHVNAVKKLRKQRAAALENLLMDEQRAKLKELRAAGAPDQNP
jgi:hypothetical protein